jgi:N-terminal domain of reverse transcriptase
MTEAPEPEDKFDAATKVAVNGPEDVPFDWRQVDWRRVEDDVRRLRQRIFTASKAGAQRLRATRACLSPVRRKPHAGFLGGLGRSNAPGPIRQVGYPSNSG